MYTKKIPLPGEVCLPILLRMLYYCGGDGFWGKKLKMKAQERGKNEKKEKIVVRCINVRWEGILDLRGEEGGGIMKMHHMYP